MVARSHAMAWLNPPAVAAATLLPKAIGLQAVLTTVGFVILMAMVRKFWLRGSRKQKPPLCLHFDVNETIMLGDPAGGDSYDDSLNKILAKVAFVKPAPPESQRPGQELSRWTWHDGSPLALDERDPSMAPPPLLVTAFKPPAGCLRFYEVPELKKQFAKTFTEETSPGAIYLGELAAMRDALHWPAGVPRDPHLCSADGYYSFLPSFFHTLVALRDSERPCSVVLRTFGTDLPHLLKAIDAFAAGKHPLFPNLQAPELRVPPQRTWVGRYAQADGSFTLASDPGGHFGFASQQANASPSSPPPSAFTSEEAVLQELQGDVANYVNGRRGAASIRVSAVQDDYRWWKAANYSPRSGKPLWLTVDDKDGWRHIFFDDNIHADAHDSIVAVRARRAPGEAFQPVSGEDTIRLHGTVLKKVPTVSAVRTREFFLQRISECEDRIAELQRRDAEGSSGGFGDVLLA